MPSQLSLKDSKVLINKLKRLQKTLGLSNGELCNQLKVSSSALSSWKNEIRRVGPMSAKKIMTLLEKQ